jgi:hypothetical protein
MPHRPAIPVDIHALLKCLRIGRTDRTSTCHAGIGIRVKDRFILAVMYIFLYIHEILMLFIILEELV